MTTLHMEVQVPNYDDWRKVFDSNMSMREQFGASHVQVFREVDNGTTVFVLVDVESVEQAERLLTALREQVFTKNQSVYTTQPKVTITEADAVA